MKNITLSITDLQHRRIRIWAAQRGRSASFIVRRVLEDLPRIARALQAVNAYELDRMGLPPTTENQALVDFMKPVPRNKKLALLRPEKQIARKQPTQPQAVPSTGIPTETSVIDCGTVQQIKARDSESFVTGHDFTARKKLGMSQEVAGHDFNAHGKIEMSQEVKEYAFAAHRKLGISQKISGHDGTGRRKLGISREVSGPDFSRAVKAAK